MLKKLVAITLAALMLINPMTAMAVSWSDVKTAVVANRNIEQSFDDGAITATMDAEGNVTVVGKNGSIENFFHSEEFKSYTFSGEIHFNGETFQVYVKQNSDGTSEKVVVEMGSDVAIHTNKVELTADDGNSLEMTGDAFLVEVGGEQQTIVMIGDNVAVTAGDVRFSAGDNASMEVTVDGTIDNVDAEYVRWETQLDEDGNEVLDENGYPVLVQVTVPGGVSFDAHQDSSLIVDLNGTIATEDLHIRVDENADLDFVNDGEILAQEQVGIYAGENSNGKLDFTNNGEISVNLDTSDDIYDEEVDDNHIGGVMVGSWENTSELTFTNTEDGVVYGDVTGWLDDTNEGASLTISNEGEINGNFDAWGQSGEGAIELDNQGGTISGEMASFTKENTSAKVTNSGTVEGEIWVNNEGEQDMTVTNSGTVGSMSINNDGTATTTATNSGTVNETLWAGTSSGTIDVTNEGTVHGEFNLGAAETGTINAENAEGATVDGAIQAWGEDSGGTITVTNSGSADMLYAGVGANATVTATNAATGTVNVQHSDVEGGTLYQTNEGTVTDQFSSEVNSGNAYNTNSGTIEGYMFTNVNGEEAYAEVTNTETGVVNVDIGVGVSGGTAEIVNNGITENLYSDAFDGAEATVTNTGKVNNELVVSTEQSTIEVTNDGTVSGQLDAYAYGEGASVTVENNNTVGSGEDGNGIWIQAGEGGKAEVTNNDTVNGELGGGVYEGSAITINNTENASAESSWINAHGGDVALNDEGTVSGTLSVSIGTQSNDVTSTETVAKLLEQTGVDISGYANVDIYTANQDGELIARYSVAEDGTVVLEEILLEEEESGDGDDPRFWTKERIRHDMEEKRKAAEIGGVYGSPYWLKQLYLGYMSLNLRLFNGEEQLLFKENISWVPGANVAGEKVLTLNVKIEDTANLTMRLDGAVIEKLDQADIVTINIVDGAGNLFMEYAVQDLKDARAMYGLTEKEYIVVGSADADVLKIAEDGTISPIEGETEAEPVEEVADKAAEETTEEAAEETPAA